MVARSLPTVLHYLRALGDPPDGPGDGLLLERFVRGDGTAFEALLRRHGRAVMGVCRRVLGDVHEAEDAFQATFLLLVRKAGSLRQPERLGAWLHGVAYRTAVRARARAARRRGTGSVEELAAPPEGDALVWRELRPLLDEAVAGLPAKYREPFVLCHLEGLTHAQAARALGCPPGTVATRLSRARAALRRRLARRGLAPSAALLAAALAHAIPPTVSASLLRDTARAGLALAAGPSAGAVAPGVAALLEGVWRSMVMERLRLVVLTLACVALSGAGVGVLSYRARAVEPATAPQPPPPLPVAPPVVAVPAAERAEPAASYRTANFRVEAPTRRVARLVAEAAEQHRRAQAVRWLGREMPPWRDPCPIRVVLGNTGIGGATSFAFDKGRVLTQDMHLEGTLDRILSSALPHEVTHTVLAHHFRRPIPRWADEGAALLAEDEDEQDRHQDVARQILDNPERNIPLSRLFRMKSYPRDVMTLFAEGYSVTRFLVERKDHKTFLAFVEQGSEGSWDEAVRDHYGFRDVADLERAWAANLRATRKASRVPPARSLAQVEGTPPLMAVAVLEDGRIAVQMPIMAYAPIYYPLLGASYKPAVRQTRQTFELDRVEVYDTDGKRVDGKQLAKLLRHEWPVLVATDGRKVDRFYLRLIRKDALILVPPVQLPVAPPPAPPAPVAYPASVER